MNCPRCGIELVPDAVFCHSCGADLRAPTSAGDDRTAGKTAGKSSAARPADNAAADERAPGAALRARGQQAAVNVDLQERELWQGGYSPKAMVGKAVLAAVLSVVAIGVAIAVGENVGWWIALVVIAVVWLFLAGELAYRRLSVHYRATNIILYHESGILRRTTDRVELIDMDDISYTQGIVDRMLGVGTVTIRSSDVSDPVLRLVGIDDVREVAARLDNARREERMRRGLYIESV
ncbi:MAG: PH domain-containing protein [Planctomycetales bacterium]|nr:PH domain-containing protein [Planctomycetales bacterium]